MSEESPFLKLMAFPITGIAMSRLLALFPASVSWTIEDLELLASRPSDALQLLLGKLAKGPIVVSSSKLREALESADQIVALLAKVQGNEETALSIEDGDLLKISIGAQPAAR